MLGVFTIEGFFAGSQLYQDLESCCVENRLQQSKGGGGYCTSPGERGVWLRLGWDRGTRMDGAGAGEGRALSCVLTS